MKKLMLLLALLLSTPALANINPVTQTRLVYSSTNVTTSAWVQLVASLPSVVTQIEIFDSSGKTLELGLGAPGQEVVQAVILPGGNGTVPLWLPPSGRISVKALSGTANAGELDINFYK